MAKPQYPIIRLNVHRNQMRAIPALLENRTIAQAAQQTGISERTLYRWLKDPLFTAELDRVVRHVIDKAEINLSDEIKKNHALFRKIRDNEDLSSKLRLQATIALDNSLTKWMHIRRGYKKTTTQRKKELKDYANE